MVKNVLIIICGSMLLGCESFVETSDLNPDPTLVAQAQITVGIVPQVFLSRMGDYTDYGSTNIHDFKIPDAVCVISQGEQVDTLQFDEDMGVYKGNKVMSPTIQTHLRVDYPGFPTVTGSITPPGKVNAELISRETLDGPNEWDQTHRFTIQVSGMSTQIRQPLWVFVSGKRNLDPDSHPMRLYFSVQDPRFFSSRSSELGINNNEENLLETVGFFKPTTPSESVVFSFDMTYFGTEVTLFISAISPETYTHFTNLQLKRDKGQDFFSSKISMNTNLVGGEGFMYGLDFVKVDIQN